jgi:hypothetical protein
MLRALLNIFKKIAKPVCKHLVASLMPPVPLVQFSHCYEKIKGSEKLSQGRKKGMVITARNVVLNAPSFHTELQY